MNAKEKILLVDDNKTFLDQLSMRLEAAGYIVLTATDGLEALKTLEQQSIDLILADVAMPNLNGYQLFQQISENPAWVSIPFILLTARTLDSDVRFGKELGIDDYLTKPVNPEDLLATIRGKLRRAQKLSQVFSDSNGKVNQRLQKMTLGVIEIDPDRHQVFLDGKAVRLSAREFKLLLALAEQPGRVVPPQELVYLTHGFTSDPMEASNFIRPLVRTLRRKLGYTSGERGCVENVRGVGYRLVMPSA